MALSVVFAIYFPIRCIIDDEKVTTTTNHIDDTAAFNHSDRILGD